MKHRNPYKLSRDYDRLKHLLDNRYIVVCFADYRFKRRGKKEVPNRDICKVWKDEFGIYDVCARGISYCSYNPASKEMSPTFNEMMEFANIEFIDVQEQLEITN
ncbi:MAG: hypothetical protein FWC34_00265 [Bacteroidetes bacterium]|nr:hypothetical protein [Bacteroidota bacterium]